MEVKLEDTFIQIVISGLALKDDLKN